MAKDNYNIDDILSEVKNGREDSVNNKISKEESAQNAEKMPAEAPAEEKEEPKPIIKEEKPEPKVEQQNDQPKSEPVEESSEDDGMVDLFSIDTDEPEPESDELTEDEMVDIFQIEDENGETKAIPKEEPKPVPQNPPKKEKKNTLKKVIAILLVLILVAGAAGGGYVYYALNKISTNGPKNPGLKEKEWDGMDKLIEVFEPIEETDASQLASLQDMIKTWYYNGTPASSTHVLNILLVGEDTRGNDILDSGTRADSAMIASINIDQKTIQLTSILRDAYAYWENEPGNPDTGTYNKINAAMALGDIYAYKNAVEKLYKVQIDNYVIVNFDSFKAIIDAMGGVTLELTSAEINEINNHQRRYNKTYIEQTFEGDKGKIKLNGKQALAYCRIRKLDSDNMRANRQKICITQVAKQAKNVSPTTLVKIVNKLLPYVKTDMKKSTILKVAKYALKQGWLDYQQNTTNMPEYRIGERGSGGVFNFAGGWIWKADYPHDAYMLQTMIYGKSSITLARTRVDYINCTETGYFSEGAPAVWATIPNENYGQVTTIPPTTKKAEEGQQ